MTKVQRGHLRVDVKDGRQAWGVRTSPQALNASLAQTRETSMPAKTSRQREAERREKKLGEMREQIQAGTLTVRQMTPAERERHPPPDRPTPRRRWPGAIPRTNR